MTFSSLQVTQNTLKISLSLQACLKLVIYYSEHLLLLISFYIVIALQKQYFKLTLI